MLIEENKYRETRARTELPSNTSNIPLKQKQDHLQLLDKEKDYKKRELRDSEFENKGKKGKLNKQAAEVKKPQPKKVEVEEIKQIILPEVLTIKELADKGSCVIVGRCADYILRDRKELFSVFVHAPLPDRIRRTAERERLSEREAMNRIKRQDKQRAGFYNFYSGGRWGEASTYDLCIDSSFTGIERTCDLLASWVQPITGK